MNTKLIYIENGDFQGSKQNILYNGLLTNKNVSICNSKELCDYIFIDALRDGDKIKNYDKKYLEKLIIIDYRDLPNDVLNIKCLKYFKRSVVNKNNLEYFKYDREIIPISYCLKNETLKFENIYNNDRYIDISIFFTPSNQSYRTRLAKFIEENFNNYNIFVGICGEAQEVGRNTIQMEYYEKMFKSKIVVTCNPDQWEGDWRTWEALSSGALVFVDNIITPINNPLINKEHIVFYDRNNFKELQEQIIFYLKNPELAKNIAKKGNEFVLKHHKPSDRIDEILSYLN